VKIFDLRAPAYAPSGPNTNNFTHPLSAAALTIPASTTEILSLDWNKYRPLVLASTGVDKMIKVWDCRMVKLGGEPGMAVGGNCELSLPGHEYAVRKVQWSPHHPDVLATASYDMTCRMCVQTPLFTNLATNGVSGTAGVPLRFPVAVICYIFTIPTLNLL
jgi:peroxin-7